ncbi:MAG: hypothetical protein HFH62_03685 [Lachnospiraceae bacterium]|nr:hypothetical protein [Lachnospiraceae bacterium]
MTQLLVYRERLIKFYQNHAPVIHALLRFLLGFVSFYALNHIVGYQPELNHWYVEFLLAVVGVILPGSAFIFLLAVFSVVHILYVSSLLAFVVGMLYAILYCSYIKFVPRHGYVIVALPILLYLHLGYAVPICLGLTMTPLAVIPIACGVGVYYLLQTITSVVSTSNDTSISLYQLVLQRFLKNEEMYVVFFVFATVAILVYLVRKRESDYAFEWSIIAGTACSIVLFLVANYAFTIRIGVIAVILGNLASMLAVQVYQFFRLALNYASVENLQFEDEEYYYYVRAVPKISVAEPDKSVKKFSVRRFAENSARAERRKQEDRNQEISTD